MNADLDRLSRAVAMEFQRQLIASTEHKHGSAIDTDAIARALLTELRNPSGEMLNSGWAESDCSWQPICAPEENSILAPFQAMIDSILSASPA